MTLFYGGFSPGVGGGLCQLSDMIYWLTLHTLLKITERVNLRRNNRKMRRRVMGGRENQ